MNKKESKENIVIKRDYIDNSVLEEMNQKYPKITVKGVAYDLGLTYITLQTDYFTDPIIRKLIKSHGAEIIAVICYFRMKMCQPFGWYCQIDEDSLDTIIEDCAFALKLNEDKVRECYEALIDKKAFFVINDESGTYLTDTQQLYNFEILNNNRLRDRQRKAAARAAKKEQEEKERAEKERTERERIELTNFVLAASTPAPAPVPAKEEPVEQNAPEVPIDDLFGSEDDNPFGW